MSETPDIETQRYGAPRSAADVLGASSGPQGEPEPQGPTEEPSAPQAAEQAAPEPEQKPLRQFDPRYREALTGMIYLGRLEDRFEWGGHAFHIRTLTAGETIEAGILIKPALGTRQEMKAHQAATVAGGLVSVDNQPLILPLGTDEITQQAKYVHLLKNWNALTIDMVYSRIYALEIEAKMVADALGEAHSQGL